MRLNIDLEMCDEHLVDTPSVLRFGSTVNPYDGCPNYILEIEADDAITNTLNMDKLMIEDLMRALLDALQVLELDAC